MSTVRLIGRIPASSRRRAIQNGVRAVGSMPVTVSAVKRLHPGSPWIGDESSRTTGKPLSVGASVGMSAGSVNAWSLSIAYSRAIPRMLS